ncbi:hypothetical protein ABW20_dc0108011 [Dactylellina cionopaga]|nr:hypothetical protein ABW20_dc0108011 [Dactylellina cionopaga]
MEMKQMQRGSSSIEARRERERRAEEKAGLIAIKPLKPYAEGTAPTHSDDTSLRSGKKGFKSAFGNEDQVTGKGFKKAFAGKEDIKGSIITKTTGLPDTVDSDDATSDTDDESYSIYDPSRPTL